MKHYDRRGLVGLFKELRGVVMEYDTDKETVIAGLLDVAKVEFEDGDGPTVVRWKFGEGFREIIAQCTKGRFLGVFGEPTVNVLKVNLMLDGAL